MNPIRHLRPLALLALIPTGISHAATPEEVTSAYFDKLKAGEYQAACEHFAPEAVKGIAGIVDKLAGSGDEGETLKQFLGESATPESIAKMSPMDKCKRFMETVFKQIEGVRFSKFEVIGTVAEGDDLRHVVARTTIEMGGSEIEAVDVSSLKKAGDSWGLLLSADLEAMVSQLDSLFGGE